MARLDVFAPVPPDDPCPPIETAGRREPLAISGRGIEIVDYDLGRAVLRDPRARKDHMAVVEAAGITSGPVHELRQRVILSQQGARHARLRRPLARFFTGNRVEAMRPGVRRIVDRLLDDIGDPAEPINLFPELCSLLPAEVYCTWVGAPREDAPFVARLATQVLTVFHRDPSRRATIEDGYAQLLPYLRRHIRERHSATGDNMLSALIAMERSGTLSPDELEAEVVALLEAGTDNTAHQLGLVLAALLKTAGAWQSLARDRSLIPAAVDEAIRYDSRIRALQRVLAEPVRIAGHSLAAGTVLNVNVSAIHHDGHRYEAPHRFRLGCERRSSLMSFSSGPYSCVGMQIAKIEIQEAVDALVVRFPQARLADEVGYFRNAFVSAAPEIPVILGRCGLGSGPKTKGELRSS